MEIIGYSCWHIQIWRFKMMKLGVDQFTLILIPNEKFDFDSWRLLVAPKIINIFNSCTKIESILGKLSLVDANVGKDINFKLPTGYTKGYYIKNALFYFSIAYNEAMPNMCVIIYFSATAWKIYCENYTNTYNKPMNIRRFLKMIKTTYFKCRLSRLDICVDFIDEGLSVSQLSKSIQRGRTEVRYGKIQI